MSLTIKGKLIKILNSESGVSRSGNTWKKQEFLIETQEQFPRKICMSLFNDKVALLEGIAAGDDVEVSFDIESREFNNKWYHNINAWKIENKSRKSDFPVPPPPPFANEDGPPEINPGESDDLPF